jgi:hypothetical protein
MGWSVPLADAVFVSASPCASDRLPEIYLPNEQPKKLGLMINLSAAKSLTA